MKTVLLLRHAKSSWKDVALPDIDRPLNGRGRAAARQMRDYMVRERWLPAQVLCSPSKRTRETLDVILEAFGEAVPVRYEKGIYLAEAPVLLRRLRRLNESLASVMVVGHNPGLERLALMLTEGEDDPLRHELAAKFPTGTFAAIGCDIDHWTELKPGCGNLEAFTRPRKAGKD
ncbi:SixA phosphatase family protein [Defluviicoccus vanus]|uniref:Histidine phosphatase family protein n=1 Tax=Defluviicoccus vanus TaxID=111831 RepID=A0A7H1MY02_9PROT|nr:histidine phosphatase family protein [Defluviicoccus vanus]QNT68338.1 histidine phosphatase family protein [Defluviicoccus vanus]